MPADTKQRSSNIELLRILSMFLVLVLHANFLGIGVPTSSECITAPVNAFLRFFVESLAIVAIDVFVLISGWFGIKPTIKKFAGFLFQIVFFTLSILLLFWLIKGRSVIGLKPLLRVFMVTKGYWFIKSYICLYILSPVLNLFAEKAPRKLFSWVLLGFFAFQTIYGWTDSAPEFYFGYSALSFIGIYLLARYLRMYPVDLLSNRRLCLGIYVSISIILALCLLLLTKADLFPKYALTITLSYINPAIIVSSIALFFTFNCSKIKYSKAINWIAASSFTVFIIHSNEFILPYYKEVIWHLYSNFPVGLRALAIILFLLLVFIVCVLLDQIRLFIWHKIEKAFDKTTSIKVDG